MVRIRRASFSEEKKTYHKATEVTVSINCIRLSVYRTIETRKSLFHCPTLIVHKQHRTKRIGFSKEISKM